MAVDVLTSLDSTEEVFGKLDKATQASCDSENDLLLQIATLKSEIENLQCKNKKLEVEIKEAKVVISNIKNIFTEGQMRKLTHPDQLIHWSLTDISEALTIHAAGARAYRHLYQKGFPLPCESTLQKWMQKLKFSDGILHFVIELMQNGTDMPPEDRLTVLAFDEMAVASVYEHDPISDLARKPSHKVQVVIARGLKSSWKQPIFYDFDQKMTAEILMDIIHELYMAGYPVVATVSDLGGSNRGLWGRLGVSTERTWFDHPSLSGGKVFVFADPPHLLKLIRNHFSDDKYLVDGKVIGPETISQVMKHTSSSDVSITYKLTEGHLDVKRDRRQKVKLAAQLFSHTVASAIRRCYELGKEVLNPCETAEFFDLVNDWFDLLNSKLSTISNTAAKKPYGMDIGKQEIILDRMSHVFGQLIVIEKPLLPFQEGILITNASLKGLHEYVTSKYDMRYLVTYRLNQDIVENFFGAMRAKGGLYDHPSPLQFKYRLRKYLLARNTEILGRGSGNVEPDETDWLQFSDFHINPLVSDEVQQQEESLTELVRGFRDDNLDELAQDGLEYLAGYIIRRLNLTAHESNDYTFTWIDQLSHGGLKKPSAYFKEQINLLERLFQRLNGASIYGGDHFSEKLISLSQGIELPIEVKKLFFRCRMHMRIKYLNKCLKS